MTRKLLFQFSHFVHHSGESLTYYFLNIIFIFKMLLFLIFKTFLKLLKLSESLIGHQKSRLVMTGARLRDAIYEPPCVLHSQQKMFGGKKIQL